MHLFRGRERTWISKRYWQWCTKHKTWQVYHNINVYDMHFDDCVYSYLDVCHCVIHAIVIKTTVKLDYTR